MRPTCNEQGCTTPVAFKGRNPNGSVAYRKICEYHRPRNRRVTDEQLLKQHAREKVQRAVANGHMRRKPCIQCGATDTEGHHEDYSYALDVIWLCKLHHLEVHGLSRKY